MDEKVLIVSERKKPVGLLIVAIILILVSLSVYALNIGGVREYSYHASGSGAFGYVYDEMRTVTHSLFEYLVFDDDAVMTIPGAIIFYLGVVFFIIWLIIFNGNKKVSLTVTDKRVYGTAFGGKRVDLPFDMISAVGTSAMNGINVSTSSGVIKFKYIANNYEIHETISKILLERQEKAKAPAASPAQTVVNPTSADELKKYKELLDSGVITQEEFDAKKKQLLGL